MGPMSGDGPPAVNRVSVRARCNTRHSRSLGTPQLGTASRQPFPPPTHSSRVTRLSKGSPSKNSKMAECYDWKNLFDFTGRGSSPFEPGQCQFFEPGQTVLPQWLVSAADTCLYAMMSLIAVPAAA